MYRIDVIMVGVEVMSLERGIIFRSLSFEFTLHRGYSRTILRPVFELPVVRRCSRMHDIATKAKSRI